MADMDEAEDAAWRLGTFQILFVSMGQGDCCIVTCPDGAHIMIDCGSEALEAADAMIDVQNLIRSPGVLGLADSQQNQLAALILTHSDKDHINKVGEIIGGDTYYLKDEPQTYDSIDVAKVYFSDHLDTRDDFKSSPLRFYGASSCATTLYYYSNVKEMYCVTLRRGAQALHKWVPPFDKTKYSKANGQINNNRVTVRDGDNWEVSIIAGNVARIDGDNDADGKNAASLVTLVRLGDERALICGDATRSTETYLYNTFKGTKDIKSLTLLQAPHHGSSVTSSTAKFVGLVKPQRVAISVQQNEHSHHLPGITTLDAYIVNAVADEARPCPAWRSITSAKFNELKTAWIKGLKNREMAFDEQYDSQWRLARFVRSDADATFEGEVILDGFNSQSKYVLHQRALAKDIRQTGLDQHLYYFFP